MNKKVLYIVSYGFLAGVLLFFLRNKVKGQPQSAALNPEVSDAALSDKYNFHLIPDGKGNYRSAQISAADLPYVIKKYGIKRIIRLNGDGNDGRHRSSHPITTQATEQALCGQNGCEYYRVSAHSGYVRNKGYTTSIKTANDILAKGNTLIHCAHGADRTGGLVGAWVKQQGVITDNEKLWSYTTQYNSWNSMIRNGTFYGSGYDKYADCFYPIDQLKAKRP